MPQPNKKRGRRMGGKKRKLEDDAEDYLELNESNSKRRKSTADGEADGDHFDDEVDGFEDGDHDHAYPPTKEPTFFGSLDEQEQEYFKRADDMLEANEFGDSEERSLFIANVYREANGKELKLAQSQSCSRLMERLIQQSTPNQLKVLFERLGGNFIHLISHRFASHCCEALFLRAAPIVTDELLAGTPKAQQNGGLQDVDAVSTSMEALYLQTLAELKGSVGFLMTDRFASHALRVLLLVLSGEPIDSGSTKHLLQSKKKETNAVQGADVAGTQYLEKPRQVPQSFGEALETAIADSIAGLDTEQLRALAMHPNGNPTLQLLLKLELAHFGKQKGKDDNSIIRTLLPDDPITAESGSATFFSGLVYDPVGSHLAETIVQHAPAKIFKSLYSQLFKERLATLARNEVAGYVVCRVLERLGHDDLQQAHERLIPELSPMLQRGRTMIVRTLIERCTIRDIHTQAIAVQVNATWDGPDGFEVTKLLKWGHGVDVESRTPEDSVQSDAANESAAAEKFARSTEPMKVQFNILAQAMLLVPGSLSALVLDSLVTLDTTTLLNMSKDRIVSRTLQSALTSKNASIITVRKLIQRFYGHMAGMAVDTAASHVVDAMWEGTHGLAFIRERIAEELAENEQHLRESSCGRAVWRNWKMDLYKRRRNDWIHQSKIKASNDGFQSFSELDENKDQEGAPKTPIELARERHAKNKREREKHKTRVTSAKPNGPSSMAPTTGGTSATAAATS